MGEQSIATFAQFLATAPGRYLLEWEQRVLDQAVGDIFGYHALQLGTAQVDALRENRMPLRCLALEDAGAAHDVAGVCASRRESTLVTHFGELPFASQSIDLVVLSHVLEFAQEPHQVLREVDRVLVPEGHVIIIGFNPASLWGANHWMGRLGVRPLLPAASQLISLPRIKDWLKLLSFEVHRGRFGCYVPWARSDAWLARWSFMEKAGDRWWPVLGNVYALTAIKRVRGMRLVGMVRRWREDRRAALAPAPMAQRIGCAPQAATVRLVVARNAANDPAAGAAHG